MDVKATVLVAYTQNVPPAPSRGNRPSLSVDRQRPEAHRLVAADDIVDIYESEVAAGAAGETIKINLKTSEYNAVGYGRVPVRGSLIDTWV
ncbi:MAG: hypothetical protein KBG09_07645 [Syntrophobacterales bacterium]|nr:hypothetical protein [Syntrophobacterales bacterium]